MLIWLPLLGLAACSPGIVIYSASTHCWGLPWLCQDWDAIFHSTRFDLLLAVPWIMLSLGGLRAGASQLVRTRRATQHYLAMPQLDLPADVASLARELGIDTRLDVVDSPVPEAFCHGMFVPRICLTTGVLTLLSTSEIEAVLRHERHHLKRYDPLQALLWTMLDSACWWMENGAEQARLRRELAADRAVIMAGGRVSLASALLKLLSQPCQSAVPIHALAVSGISVTEARIDQLLRPEQALPCSRPLYHWFVLPTVLTLATLLCAR
jgi:Zn-dependent protease with chaperone function